MPQFNRGSGHVLATFALLLFAGCKTGGAANSSSTPMDAVTDARTLLQVHCKGTDSEFDMRFNISGLVRNPEAEASVTMDVINSANNEKVVNASPGRGYFSDKEYIYVRYAAGGLTLDWEEPQPPQDPTGKYFGAATVNADPEVTAVEVKCDYAPLNDLP
jgi:hypothetical protein